MKKLWVLLYDATKDKSFKKYFDTEFEMDKFKRKLAYSTKISVVKDCRDDWGWDYNS